MYSPTPEHTSRQNDVMIVLFHYHDYSNLYSVDVHRLFEILRFLKPDVFLLLPLVAENVADVVQLDTHV